MSTALITGITGQDGSYLAEFLLTMGYRVIGLIRRNSNPTYDRIKHLLSDPNFKLEHGDLLDQGSLIGILSAYQPNEVYNLAAQSFVPVSWAEPLYTADVTGLGAMRVLEAINLLGLQTKFYQASTSEMFGKVKETPQNEKTPFYPRSPYGVSKTFAHWSTINYRESYGMFAVSGILFNHESPRRGIEFVTRKITNGVARIVAGKQETLKLGNLESKRDWGFAGDYVKAMWMMLQRNEPEDFVVGMGETHSIADFCYAAFDCAGLYWENYVDIDKNLIRPAEVDLLHSDPTKAHEVLGWKPEYTFNDLVEMMVINDINLEKK